LIHDRVRRPEVNRELTLGRSAPTDTMTP
jgi:hypothetical protein